MCLSYMSEVQLKEVYANGFESPCHFSNGIGCRVNVSESEMLVNRNYTSLVNWNLILQLIYRVDSNKTHVSL